MKARLLFIGKVKASVDGGSAKEYNNEMEFDGKRIVFDEPIRTVLDMRHKRARVTVDGKEIGMFMNQVEFAGKEVSFVEVELHRPDVLVGEEVQAKAAVEMKPDLAKARAELDERKAALRRKEAERKSEESKKTVQPNQVKEFSVKPNEEAKE